MTSPCTALGRSSETSPPPPPTPGSSTKCHLLAGPSAQRAGASAQGPMQQLLCRRLSPSRVTEGVGDGSPWESGLDRFQVLVRFRLLVFLASWTLSLNEISGVSRGTRRLSGRKPCKRFSVSMALQSVAGQAVLQEGRSLSSLPGLPRDPLQKTARLGQRPNVWTARFAKTQGLLQTGGRRQQAGLDHKAALGVDLPQTLLDRSGILGGLPPLQGDGALHPSLPVTGLGGREVRP